MNDPSRLPAVKRNKSPRHSGRQSGQMGSAIAEVKAQDPHFKTIIALLGYTIRSMKPHETAANYAGREVEMIRWMASLAALAACSAFAQAPAAPPAFDAASVKVADPAVVRPSDRTVGGPGTSDPSRIHRVVIAMVDLLAEACGVHADQILGGPDWIRGGTESLVYEITATMPPDTTKEQFQSMLLNLLAERFHLAIHHETRNFPAYVLVVAKDGPKLKEVKPDPSPAFLPPGPLVFGRDGFPVLPLGPHTAQILSGGNWRFKYQERSMADLVGNLGLMISRSQGTTPLADAGTRRPRVIDKTGLAGNYDFTLEFACPGCIAARAVSADPAPQPRSDVPPAEAVGDPAAGAGPSIFVAFEKQLGLRLDKVQDVPLDVIVVDRVDKVPTEN